MQQQVKIDTVVLTTVLFIMNLRRVRVAKGTRDYLPFQMAIRDYVFGKITEVFVRHGAVTIDTPVFELKETLTGKYGEDSKLIFDLADQNGELLALRYDLTVPFARYVAMHDIAAIKRYHIARVYRRDNPVMSKGRFREFYQCDFDIAGSFAHMVPDAEVLGVLCEILSALPVGEFVVRLNHRKLLDACLEVSGVPAAKFRLVCSAIDKLDKEPWDRVRQELVTDKGLPEEVADRIKVFVEQRGDPRGLLAALSETASLGLAAHAGAREAFADFALLFDYLEALGALDYVALDLSLARGLDYYTGAIYEAVLRDSSFGVGSIAAGGRYDNLVGIFAERSIPAVGVSIGVERVMSVIEHRAKKENVRKCATEVYVAVIPEGAEKKMFTVERFRLCRELWAAGIKSDMCQADKRPFNKQLGEALEELGAPFVIVVAATELARGEVIFKDLTTGEKNDTTVPRAELVAFLKEKLAAYRASAQMITFGDAVARRGVGRAAYGGAGAPAQSS